MIDKIPQPPSFEIENCELYGFFTKQPLIKKNYYGNVHKDWKGGGAQCANSQIDMNI